MSFYPASISNLRFAALLAALLFYGVSGSPTPDNPGLVELVTGLLLIAAAGPVHVLNLIKPGRSNESGLQKSGRSLLLYGLSVPVLTGLVNGNDTENIIRDVFPFLFLLMPFFLWKTASAEEGFRQLLTGAVMFAGVAFAIRSQLPYSSLFPSVHAPPDAEPLYLINAPTVVFTALFMIGSIYEVLAGEVRKVRPVRLAGMCALACMLLASMAAAMQRASMASAALMLVFMTAGTFIRKPLRLVVPLAVCGVVLGVFWPYVSEIWDVLTRKTLVVGLNNRVEETAAVIDVLRGDFLAVIFGKGWGATFTSPAVGGVTVNFTHSLLTSFLLKTGLAGLVIVSVYMALIAAGIYRLCRESPVTGYSAAMPFLINIFLYASYKSMDFGIFLLLVSVLANPVGRLRNTQGYSNEDGLQKSPEPDPV